MDKIILAALGLMSLGASQPVAYGSCSSAVSDYQSATSDISLNLKRYVGCVSASAGKDDCSIEFRRVKYAQDSFESAVSDIGTCSRD